MLGYHGAAKRALDLTICLAALPFVVLVGAVIAVAIKLDSPGPALFTQVRVGLNGRPFRIFKFRTMRVGVDDRSQLEFMRAYIMGSAVASRPPGEGPLFKPDQGMNLTRVGRVLRRTSLDELPQVLNVLAGDMSLVGPRPHVPWEVEVYRPEHLERLGALPGITGLAQVRGRSNITFDRMVQFDVEYVQNASLAMDLRILGQTFTSWLRREGAG